MPARFRRSQVLLSSAVLAAPACFGSKEERFAEDYAESACSCVEEAGLKDLCEDRSALAVVRSISSAACDLSNDFSDLCVSAAECQYVDEDVKTIKSAERGQQDAFFYVDLTSECPGICSGDDTASGSGDGGRDTAAE